MKTNLELAEQIKSNLNELIDSRGNEQLIPALILVQEFVEEIHRLQRQIRALEDMGGWTGLTKAAQRAVDSLATQILNNTVWTGRERADVLDAVASILRRRASELRREAIARKEKEQND